MGAHKRARSVSRGMFTGIRQGVFVARKTNNRSGKHEWGDLGNVIGVGVLVLGLALGAVLVRSRSTHRHNAAAPATSIPATPDVAWNDAWPQLMFTGIPVRPFDLIRAAYAFAARRPDVLRSIPCFCGCARQGHGSNEACYVKGRTPSGGPRWTDHAMTCGMCVDITRDAIIMTNQQQPIGAVRDAIEARYHTQ